ncbi:T6SS immunity protein Tli4 family protein [Acerihabitans arboris]|nr:T6SS immunity protein Tli4 family protein [Acerihabitans arboris]
MQVKKTLLLFAAVGIASICGYAFIHRDMPPPTLTVEEKKVTDALFNQIKPQCIGRYVFDVPESYVNEQKNYVFLNDFRINSQRLYRPAFEQRIRLREQALKNERTVASIDGPFLKQVYRLSDNAIIFDRNENGSTAGWGRILEGHIYVGGVAFIVQTEITDYSDERYASEREFYLRPEVGRPVAKANTKPQKLAEMQDLLSRLSGRKDDEIPTQPGICIADGFIRDNSKQNKEDLSFAYRNDNFGFYVSTDNTLGKSNSLLERGDEIEPALREGNIHTIYKRKRNIAGMDAEDWLVRGKQVTYQPEAENILYSFTFYANEKAADYHHPVLFAKLSNRGIGTTTYSDAQLVDIWDRITQTFRFRPGAF